MNDSRSCPHLEPSWNPHHLEIGSILLVDDDPAFRETFADVMALRGTAVLPAAGAAQALRLAASLERLPDAFVLDVQLPDMDGIDLCRWLKRDPRLRHIPVVLLSAASRYNDWRDRAEGLLAGAAIFLPKPVTMDRLWEELGLLVSGGVV